MHYRITTTVRVMKVIDPESDANQFIGKPGKVIYLNTNGKVGNTIADPLHVLLFDDNTTESFWYEELVEIKAEKNNRPHHTAAPVPSAEEIKKSNPRAGSQKPNGWHGLKLTKQ